MATNLRGADIVIKTLERTGYTTIFTLSGNHIMSLFDAAIDSKLQLMHVRHEAASVHMADAYGRLTGKPGIAWVTGGPGHANAVGALFTAQGQESPWFCCRVIPKPTNSAAADFRSCVRPRWPPL